jgi:hypothetical protein
MFAPTRPNEVWVTDITYIPTAEGWLYLAGLKDVFTCEIVGYAMGERMTQELTTQALWRAVSRKRPEPGLIHHSDRGSQYCAHAYQDLVAQFGMRASMSRRGNCYDNAPMESFWGTLKNELVHHRRYATRAEAKASIQEYIEIFYNRQRRHSRIGFVPPACSPNPSANSRRRLKTSVSAIDSTPQSSIVRGAPDRRASSRPSSRDCKKRPRHLQTVCFAIARSAATHLFSAASEHPRIMRERKANACAVLRRLAHTCN